MERYEYYRQTDVVWLGEIPKEWTVIRLKFLADITTGNRDTVDAEIDGIYPFFVRSKNIERINDYAYDGEAILTAGDGDIGKIVHYIDGKFNFHQRVYCIYNVKMNAKFLYYFFAQFFINEAERHNAKSTVDSIRLPVLKNFPVVIPNSGEQARIVLHLDRRIAEIDSLLADLQSQVEMLDTYKRELIAEAVTKGFNKSAAMKNSGVDYIGMIPEAWEMLPLFAVAKENSVRNTGLVCENLLSLSYGKIIRKDIDTNFGLLPASFESYQIVQPGYTVLRFTDLQNDKRSLRSGYVTETGIITSAYMVLIPSERLDSKYFSYLLHAYDLMKVYYGMGGGLRQTLKFSDVKRLPVLIPTMSEQKAIVAYVDEKTTKIESLIADITAQIEKLKQYRQIVIHDAVTGKIKVTEG